jgi:hypothetical protein
VRGASSSDENYREIEERDLAWHLHRILGGNLEKSGGFGWRGESPERPVDR